MPCPGEGRNLVILFRPSMWRSLSAAAGLWQEVLHHPEFAFPLRVGEGDAPPVGVSTHAAPSPHCQSYPLEGETVGWVTYSIAWTQDGSHLLFSKRVASPTIPSELWRVSAEGGEPQRIGLATWGRGGVRAHPDGRRIAFTNQTDRKNELWMIENFLPQPSVAR